MANFEAIFGAYDVHLSASVGKSYLLKFTVKCSWVHCSIKLLTLKTECLTEGLAFASVSSFHQWTQYSQLSHWVLEVSSGRSRISRKGRWAPRRGAWTSEAVTFQNICMSKRKNLDPWGDVRRARPPLDLPMVRSISAVDRYWFTNG